MRLVHCHYQQGTLRGYLEDHGKNDFDHRMAVAADKESRRQLLEKWIVEWGEEADAHHPLRGGKENTREGLSVSYHVVYAVFLKYRAVQITITNLSSFALSGS